MSLTLWNYDTTLWYITYYIIIMIHSQTYYKRVYHKYMSLYTSNIRGNPVKWDSQTFITKSYHTQSIRKNSLHKLLLDYVQILETQCSYIIIKTYENKVSIIQLYNLTELRLWKKNKYAIQFFESHFGNTPPHHIDRKNLKALSKPFSENQKVHSIG